LNKDMLSLSAYPVCRLVGGSLYIGSRSEKLVRK